MRPPVSRATALLGRYFLAFRIELLRKSVSPGQGGVEVVDLFVGEFVGELVEVVAFLPGS